MKGRNRILLLAAGLVIVLAVLVLGGGTALADSGFAGGEGTAGRPWLIETAEQLNNVRNYLGEDNSNKFFRLTADIDLSGYDDDWRVGDNKGWFPIGTFGEPFTGFFDGGGHTITGLYIYGPDAFYVGLFGEINGASILNVRLEDLDVTCNKWVGGLVGRNNGGTIENSYATGAVSGNSILGGLVGQNPGTVTASYYNKETTGQSDNTKGQPKTTAEMKQQATFDGWDFEDTWEIDTGIYPYLKWQEDYKTSHPRCLPRATRRR